MTEYFGAEILKSSCPEKYLRKSSLISDCLSTFVAFLIVAYFSGNLFKAGGLNSVTIIIIEAVVILFFTVLTYFLFKGVKKRLSETYISICENGICGIRAVNGFKNAPFSVSYDGITKISHKSDRVYIDSNQGKIILTLNNAEEAVRLIREKCNFH